jgi:hypothetical protein
MQQQVVSLTGASLFVEAGPGLRRRVAAALSVPEEFLRLTHNARELRGDGDEALDASVPVRARLRLEGGKGGFGAMLRQSGKANVKTTNFDACRDLSRRRRAMPSRAARRPSRGSTTTSTTACSRARATA